MTSQLTLHESFFDKLWPLILEKNVCDTHSKNTSEFFVPEQRFDLIWAQSLLAERGFKDYTRPLSFRCFDDGVEVDGQKVDQPCRQSKPPAEPATSEEHKPEECPQPTRKPPILSIDKQILLGQYKETQRKKLADGFINRQFPWYTQRSKRKLEMTDEIYKHLDKPLQGDLIRNLIIFGCKFIVLDFGADIPLKEIKTFLTFCDYVPLIVVVRCMLMVRMISGLGDSFHAILVEENFENTWQEELSVSLNAALHYASENGIYRDCTKTFAFVFSKTRCGCSCDEFKILREF